MFKVLKLLAKLVNEHEGREKLMYLNPSFCHHNDGTVSTPSSEPPFLLTDLLYPAIVISILIFLFIQPVNAQQQGSKKLDVTIDTTVSQGVSYRMEDRDLELIDSDPNGDDGNLNYDKGMISNTSKITSDLHFAGESGGFFGRFTAYTDHFNSDRQRDRTALSPEAHKLVATDARLLDLYAYKEFQSGNVFGEFRIGQQVLNWGESTFIQNGINIVNPVDVSRLRTPGSELREALVPVPLIVGSVSPNDRLSLEGFYQLKWKKTEIDPVGSYFSTVDYVGAGASIAEIDLRTQGVPLPPNDLDDWLKVDRGPDVTPKDSGQFGIALRYLSETMNDTEFGFYYTKYHSRRPLVAANTGGAASLLSGVAGAGAVAAAGQTAGTAIGTALAQGQSLQQAIVGFVNTAPALSGFTDNEKTQLAGQMIHATSLAAQAGAPLPAQLAVLGDVFRGYAAQVGIDRFARDASYQVNYPEDIGVFGLSFNTLLGNSGWALQGEVTHRSDAPLQIDDARVLANGLAPILGAIDPRGCPRLGAQAPACISQIATSLGASGVPVAGFIRRDVSQIQFTATKIFGPSMGADTGLFLIEAARTQVHNMPDPEVTPLDGPGGSFGTSSSWGYRAAAKLDYFNAVGPVNVSPYLQFQVDASGTTPNPIGNFIEGRRTITYGLGFDYLQRWGANLNYTRYFGADLRNKLKDRDFLSFSVNYSF